MNWSAFLFSFKGRVSRTAFWLVFLAGLVVGGVLQFAALGSAMFGEFDPANPPSIPVWYWLAQIPLIWIGLANYCKRWHDQDKSGWFSLLLLIPILGWLIWLVMLGFIGGSPGPNRFGDEP